MNYDLQLARGDDGNGYNLAVGEPWFLHDELAFIHETPLGHLGYPSMQGEPALIKELKARFPGRQVVVTNGAKQALAAALYALEMQTAFPNKHAWHTVPYWPSFPTLAALAGLKWSPNVDEEYLTYISIETWPNNPTGTSISLERSRLLDCKIWDAAYAHAVYGWDGSAPNYDILVQGAAKLLGMAGLRVGWLVTSNKEIAKSAAFFVEATTSGVCVSAQRSVAATLGYMDKNPEIAQGAYDKARVTLLKNGQIFKDQMTPYVESVQGVPDNGSGMFAWFLVKEEFREKFIVAMKKIQMKLVSGVACGMSSPGWYRMSMGHRNGYTRYALKDLTKALADA